MHKSSGKHMPDSSDEFKVTESSDSDWDAEQKKKEETSAERMKALSDLVKKTAVVPLEKLPEDVTKAKTEELQAHLGKWWKYGPIRIVSKLLCSNIQRRACEVADTKVAGIH